MLLTRLPLTRHKQPHPPQFPHGHWQPSLEDFPTVDLLPGPECEETLDQTSADLVQQNDDFKSSDLPFEHPVSDTHIAILCASPMEQLPNQEPNNALLAELSTKLNKPETPVLCPSPITDRAPLIRPCAVAALNDGDPGNSSGERNEIHQLKDMIEKLSCDFDARIQSLASIGPRDNYTASIAAFSEVNNRDTPKLLKEIRRVEISVVNKLERLSSQRLDHRRNHPRLQK